MNGITSSMATYDSGKVDLVMVACVAREVTMIVQPAIFYNVSRIHILNFVSEKDESEAGRKRAEIYRDIRDEVCRRLEEEGIEVIMHDSSPTYRFSEMIRNVFQILSEEKKRHSTVFINISGGTNEYAAAAAIAGNMFDNTRLFNVGARNSVESAEQLRGSVTQDGRIVGTTDGVWDPYSIRRFRIEPPDPRLLEALSVFADVPVEKRANTRIVHELIERGIWKGLDEGAPRDRKIVGTSLEVFDKIKGRATDRDLYHKRRNSENVRYQKMFVDKWKAKGWIEQDGRYGSRKYDLTEEGRMNLKIFKNKDVQR